MYLQCTQIFICIEYFCNHVVITRLYVSLLKQIQFDRFHIQSLILKRFSNHDIRSLIQLLTSFSKIKNFLSSSRLRKEVSHPLHDSHPISSITLFTLRNSLFPTQRNPSNTTTHLASTSTHSENMLQPPSSSPNLPYKTPSHEPTPPSPYFQAPIATPTPSQPQHPQAS